MASGTGYTLQYRYPVAQRYEHLATCPDELLLFFHHVPYIHKLNSGKTVIQHIYDTHFEGALQAESLVQQWEQIENAIDHEQYEGVLLRLKEQAEHATHWRDMINTYFLRKSGIGDQGNRKLYS
ncbi:Xylan alpha-(1-_2)-glucuronosidase [compost metagenome]